MIQLQHDPARVARWRWRRRKIRLATGEERFTLLKKFGSETRILAPLAAKISTFDWDMNVSLELSRAIGVIIGAWLNTEPSNPGWPGRDRLFLTRPGDLITACSCLATLGFFTPGQAAKLVDETLVGGKTAIPGLAVPQAPPEAVPALAWESALESARSKRRWRENFSGWSDMSWAAPSWRESPAVWRTCALINMDDPSFLPFRDMPATAGEAASGLVVLVALRKSDAEQTAEQWRASGWEVVVIGHMDILELYETLTAPVNDKPLAVMLGIGQGTRAGASLTARISKTGRSTQLLGELTDDQFNEIMGESLQG